MPRDYRKEGSFAEYCYYVAYANRQYDRATAAYERYKGQRVDRQREKRQRKAKRSAADKLKAIVKFNGNLRCSSCRENRLSAHSWKVEYDDAGTMISAECIYCYRLRNQVDYKDPANLPEAYDIEELAPAVRIQLLLDGEGIMKARKKARMSLRKTAEVLNISHSHLNRVETGELQKWVDIVTFHAFVDILQENGCTINTESLLEELPPKEKQKEPEVQEAAESRSEPPMEGPALFDPEQHRHKGYSEPFCRDMMG